MAVDERRNCLTLTPKGARNRTRALDLAANDEAEDERRTTNDEGRGGRTNDGRRKTEDVADREREDHRELPQSVRCRMRSRGFGREERGSGFRRWDIVGKVRNRFTELP